MKYEIEGGGHIEATSPLELVEYLRRTTMSLTPSVSVEDYMEDLAARSKIQDGSTIRTDSAENFITDLVACGSLTPVIPIILGTDDSQPAKNALLSALIQAAPADAQWFVSSDSWESIPALLAFAQEPSDHAGEWKFRISEANRPHLREVIEQYELGEKNVHMTLLSATGSHLFHSFDGLLMVVVDRSLGVTDDLRHRFPELEIDEE
jgi:hypothetical protein